VVLEVNSILGLPRVVVPIPHSNLLPPKVQYFPFSRWALIDRLVYNRLRQALGRAIRSEADQAVAVVFDYRMWRFSGIIPCRWFDELSDLQIAILCKFHKINQTRGIDT
jgi:hypothetical protein